MPCETDVAFTLVYSILVFGVIANALIWSEKQRGIKSRRTRRAFYAKNRKERYAK